jgi:hypothetical protein
MLINSRAARQRDESSCYQAAMTRWKRRLRPFVPSATGLMLVFQFSLRGKRRSEGKSHLRSTHIHAPHSTAAFFGSIHSRRRRKVLNSSSGGRTSAILMAKDKREASKRYFIIQKLRLGSRLWFLLCRDTYAKAFRLLLFTSFPVSKAKKRQHHHLQSHFLLVCFQDSLHRFTVARLLPKDVCK